jgi:hypothetical protein
MTSSKTYGYYKTKDECIQAIEKDMIKEEQLTNNNIDLKSF